MSAILFVIIISTAAAFSSRADMLPEVELGFFKEESDPVQETEVSFSFIR